MPITPIRARSQDTLSLLRLNVEQNLRPGEIARKTVEGFFKGREAGIKRRKETQEEDQAFYFKLRSEGLSPDEATKEVERRGGQAPISAEGRSVQQERFETEAEQKKTERKRAISKEERLQSAEDRLAEKAKKTPITPEEKALGKARADVTATTAIITDQLSRSLQSNPDMTRQDAEDIITNSFETEDGKTPSIEEVLDDPSINETKIREILDSLPKEPSKSSELWKNLKEGIRIMLENQFGFNNEGIIEKAGRLFSFADFDKDGEPRVEPIQRA